jgi:hypothetical protein
VKRVSHAGSRGASQAQIDVEAHAHARLAEMAAYPSLITWHIRAAGHAAVGSSVYYVLNLTFILLDG